MSESPPVRTTIYLDAVEYRRVKELAERDGHTAAQLVREAIAEYTARRIGPGRPRSIGAGRSGRGDLSSRAEELLTGLGGE